MQHCHYVRVIERSNDFRFALETQGVGAVKEFERNIAVEARITGTVDLTYAGGADKRLNDIESKLTAANVVYFSSGLVESIRICFSSWASRGSSVPPGGKLFARKND